MPAPMRPHPTTPTFPIAINYSLLYTVNKPTYLTHWTTRNPKHDRIVVQPGKVYVFTVPYTMLHSYSQVLRDKLIILTKQSQSCTQQKRGYPHFWPLLLRIKFVK